MTTRKAPTATQEVAILQRIIESISYNTDLDDTLNEIIAVVDSVAQADEIFVYLPKGKKLFLRAAKEESKQFIEKVSFPIGKGLTGWCAEHKKSVVIEKEAYADTRFLVIEDLDADRFEAFLTIPLLFQKKLVGVLNVQHKKPHTFTKRELALIETIAHATAGAIERARLFEENMVLSETLQSRKTIDRAKGRLMKHHDMSESEAYDWLKKRSMDLRKSMKEVADAVLIGLE